MNRSVYLLSFLLCMACLHPATAQFSVIAEYSQNTMNTSGLNQFTHSFNDFWGSKLSSPYKDFDGTEFSMPSFGVGFRLPSISMFGLTASTNFTYGKTKHSQLVTWSNNVKNEMEHHIRDMRWNLTGGFNFLKILYLEGYFGGQFRKMILNYYTIYPDGSKSLSQEYEINGQYTGTTAAVEYGLQAALRIDRFYLYARYTLPMKNFPPSKGLVSMDDYPSVGSAMTQFPTDYALYATDVVATVEQDAFLKTDDYEGERITIGLEIWFGMIKKIKQEKRKR